MRAFCLVLIAGCGAPAATPAPVVADKPAAAAAAITDSTLVLFEPAGDQCALQRVDPVGATSVELARVPGSCLGARMSWRADRRRAVVWFQPGLTHSAGIGGQEVPPPGFPAEEAEIAERHYEIDLDARAVTPLRMPAESPGELGYGEGGTLFAFAERDLEGAGGVKVTVEGRVLDFTEIAEGMPAAAIAYRRDGDGWVIASVTETTTGWDYARGWSAAPEADKIGPRSIALLDAHADTGEVDPAVKPALDRIAAAKPDGDGWATIATAHGPIYVWMFNAEFVHTTGRIAWRAGDGTIALLPELGFTAGELVSITTRGRYVAISGASSGTHARLYDLVGHRRVWASDTARAVTFWP